MTFPVVEATNESNETATATTHNVSLPTGIQAGDLLLILVSRGRAAAVQGFTTPGGWTELLDESTQSGGVYVGYRWADGTEGATVDLTTGTAERSAHISFRISGAANPATQAPQISASATGTSNAPNPNSLSPTGGAKDYLWITFFGLASGEEADDDTWTNNAATNYANLLQKTSGTGGTNVAAGVAASRRTNNAASEDAVWPAASLDASLSWRAFTIAIHPTQEIAVAGSSDAIAEHTGALTVVTPTPVFAGIGTQLQGTGSAMNVPAPSNIEVDDILRMSAFLDVASTTVTATPSGWTQAADSPVTGPDNHSLVIYWKRAVSGDVGASTFDWTLSASVYRQAAIERYTSAVTSGDPWDVTRGVGSNNSQTTTEDVAETTTVTNTLLCWSATNWTGGTWTPPTDFTERRDSGDGTGTSADKIQTSAGSTGTIVGTCTGSDKRCAWVGALKGPNSTSGGGAVTLDGVLESVTEHAGLLSLALALDGVSSSVAEHAGLASLALPLIGTTETVAEHTGALSFSIALEGTLESVVEHAGIASLAVGLIGALDAVAEHVASPSLSLGLSGIASAVAEHSGVSSLALALGGVSDAVSEHLGFLGLSLTLSGTSDSVAEHAGLVGLSLPLQAVSDVVGDVVGDLTLQGQVQLEGVAEAIAEHVGTLSLAIELVGVSSSVAEHAGTLGFSYDLAAVSSAVAEHAGTMQLTLALDAVTNAVAEHTGSVSLAVGLTGVSSVVAEHVGDLLTGADIALEGVSSAIAEVVGAIDLIPAVFIGVDLGSGGYHPAGLGARAGSGSLGVGQVGSHLGDGS